MDKTTKFLHKLITDTKNGKLDWRFYASINYQFNYQTRILDEWVVLTISKENDLVRIKEIRLFIANRCELFPDLRQVFDLLEAVRKRIPKGYLNSDFTLATDMEHFAKEYLKDRDRF
jgi:hypothetical protein